MSTSNRTTTLGELWLIAAIAIFAVGLLVGLEAVLGSLSIGVDGAVLSIPPLARVAVIGGTLGAVVLVPGGGLLSIAH
jgi:hypothetical protein